MSRTKLRVCLLNIELVVSVLKSNEATPYSLCCIKHVTSCLWRIYREIAPQYPEQHKAHIEYSWTSAVGGSLTSWKIKFKQSYSQFSLK